VEAVVSRRRERKWEETLGRNVHGGGEEYHTDWEGVAREHGLEPHDFTQPGGYYGEPELDVEALEEAARASLYNPNDKWPPFVMLTLKCQRCGRRLDTLRMGAGRWRAGPEGGFRLNDVRLVSEASAKVIGEPWALDPKFEMLRRLEQDGELQLAPIVYECGCGRSGIQFSRRRIYETFDSLMPKEPDWRSHNGEEYIARPTTRYASIHG
jgi:hypothetical protein